MTTNDYKENAKLENELLELSIFSLEEVQTDEVFRNLFQKSFCHQEISYYSKFISNDS